VRIARCGCGALSATCTGEPARISVCHCGACKRRTGSAFAWNATFAEGQVAVAGESRMWERRSEEGRWARMHFCPSCGGTVFYAIELRPGMVTVPAGLFADPDFPEPTVSVFSELCVPWVRLETGGTLTDD